MNPTLILNPDEMKQAREWVSDCVWRDVEPDDVETLTDEQIVRGVARHYDGGIAEFKRGCVLS